MAEDGFDAEASGWVPLTGRSGSGSDSGGNGELDLPPPLWAPPSCPKRVLESQILFKSEEVNDIN